MTDGFERMVDEARVFFAELAENNSKAWFEPQKERYKEEIAKPAALFADLIAEDLARITGKAHHPKVFRIYRDVRFSKDKTPLKAHQHVLWSPGDKTALRPAWFWGISPDYFIVGLGLMGLSSDQLTRYRALVDQSGDALEDAFDQAKATGAQFGQWRAEPLKRVPKPYPADHPHAELLKQKGFTISAPISDGWRARGVLKATLERIADLKPIWEVFNGS